jgi:hypothetical protein
MTHGCHVFAMIPSCLHSSVTRARATPILSGAREKPGSRALCLSISKPESKDKAPSGRIIEHIP